MIIKYTMMRLHWVRKSFSLLVLSAILSLPLNGQDLQNLSFERLRVEEGLHNSIVYQILQDRSGQMWFTLHDGIDRYNGYDFKHFSLQNRNGQTDYFNAQVRSSVWFNRDEFWISAGSNIFRYNLQKDKFETVIERLSSATGNGTRHFNPLINGTDTLDKAFAVSQFQQGAKVMGYSIRTERYRYTEWYGNSCLSTKAYNPENIMGIELYDYEADPHETENAVADPMYQDIANELSGLMKDFLQSQEKGLNESIPALTTN